MCFPTRAQWILERAIEEGEGPLSTLQMGSFLLIPPKTSFPHILVEISFLCLGIISYSYLHGVTFRLWWIQPILLKTERDFLLVDAKCWFLTSADSYEYALALSRDYMSDYLSFWGCLNCQRKQPCQNQFWFKDIRYYYFKIKATVCFLFFLFLHCSWEERVIIKFELINL